MADETRKSELIAELARARGEISLHTMAVRHELDLGAKIRASFRRHALPWLGGAGLLGALLTWLPSRRKKVVVKAPRWRKSEAPQEKAIKAGVFLTVLKFVFDFARPALTKWVAGRVADYARTGAFRGAPRG